METSIPAKAVLDAAAEIETKVIAIPAELQSDGADVADISVWDLPGNSADDSLAEARQVAEAVTEDAGINASEVMTENAIEADEEDVVPTQAAPIASNETYTNDHASGSDDEATPGRHNQHLNNEPT